MVSSNRTNDDWRKQAISLIGHRWNIVSTSVFFWEAKRGSRADAATANPGKAFLDFVSSVGDGTHAGQRFRDFGKRKLLDHPAHFTSSPSILD